MDLFGHVGLTLTVAYAGEHLFARRPWAHDLARLRSGRGHVLADADPPAEVGGSAPGLLDYRLVILGSLIADTLDKPLGLWIAPELVNGSTRGVGHTLVFVALLAVPWVAFGPGWRLKGLVLATSSAGHLILDAMWRQGSIVLWPFLGLSFPERIVSVSEVSSSYLRDLLTFYTEPAELVGALIILLFAARVWSHRGVSRFLRSGVGA